mgnify:CR=1 FL=1
MNAEKQKEKNAGRIVQIISSVIDVEFAGALPEIYNALEVTRDNGEKLILEVAQHLGACQVRWVAMGATDGLRRGQ